MLRKFGERGFTGLVPMVLAVIISFSILFIGAYITSSIEDNLTDTIPAAGSNQRTGHDNSTLGTMRNITGNWDSSLDIVQVVIIITILAMAVGAIFLFTRFR